MKLVRRLALCLGAVLALSGQESRLSDVSIRAQTGAGATVLTTGFVIGPGGHKPVLIRALGPALSQPPFNIAGTISDPTLTLFDAAQTSIASNDNWRASDAAAFARAGTFALTENSRDSAIVATLPPGAYTAQVRDAGNGAGLALVEIYELEASGPRLLNTSTRLQVAPGEEPVMSVIVSRGTRSRTLLVRAVGPALATFGLSGVLPNPALTVTRFGSSDVLAANDDWSVSSDARRTATDTTALEEAFARAGAFAFPADSKDAALLIELAPGSYTVHLSGAGGTGGLALVEIYDLSDAVPRLAALAASTPQPAAQTAPAVAALVAPIPNHSADTDLDFQLSLKELTRVIELYNTRNGSTRTGRYRVLDGSEDGFAPDPDTAPAATVTLARYHSADANHDGAINLVELTRVIELYNFRSGTTRTGQYHVRTGTEDGFEPSAPPVIAIAATKANSDESGTNPGQFTFTHNGSTSYPLTIAYTLGGTATPGTDHPFLAGTITIPAGTPSATLALAPSPDLVTEDSETVIVTLASSVEYTIGTAANATATIADSPVSLYVATLRPETAATDSIAFGTATLLLSASGTLAGINVSFSNLSSDQVSAHLRITPSGDFVGGLPRGQVAGSQWKLPPVGLYSSADLLSALKSGKIYVGIDTSKYPAGELKGTFIQGAGSQTFTAPPRSARRCSHQRQRRECCAAAPPGDVRPEEK